MIRKKKKKKGRQRSFRMSYVVMGALSVLVGYSVVVLLGSVSTLSLRGPRQDTLEGSARRIAVAFERYNEKRFMR